MVQKSLFVKPKEKTEMKAHLGNEAKQLGIVFPRKENKNELRKGDRHERTYQAKVKRQLGNCH